MYDVHHDTIIPSLVLFLNNKQSSLLQQRGVGGVQRADGLHYAGRVHVELWRRRHHLHPLEGTATIAAGLPDRDQRSHGADVHQVLARLDHVGRPRNDLHLG